MSSTFKLSFMRLELFSTDDTGRKVSPHDSTDTSSLFAEIYSFK
jgi:hypothetical protein